MRRFVADRLGVHIEKRRTENNQEFSAYFWNEIVQFFLEPPRMSFSISFPGGVPAREHPCLDPSVPKIDTKDHD
jgi:hypothetical protein